MKTVWSKISRGYTILAVLLLNIGLCFLVLNLTLAFIYPYIDAARINAPGADQPGSLQYRQSLLDAAYPGWNPAERDIMLHEIWTRPLQCAPYVHFREAPYQGRYVNVHETGFRYNAPPATASQPYPPDDAAVNIYVFGGSTTFGYGVADNETIPAYMEQILAERLPGKMVQVYNFGQAYYSSPQELLLFLWLIQQGDRPAVAVFIDGLNEGQSDMADLPALNCTRLDLSDKKRPRLPVERLLDSIRYRFFGIKTGAEEIETDYTPEPADAFAARVSAGWDMNRRIIQRMGEEAGIQTVFVWQPAPDYHYDLSFHPFFPEAEKNASRAGLYDTIQAMSAAQGWTNFLWLADMQLDRRELLYVDRVHYNAAFQADIAGQIVDFLLARKLLNRP